VPNCYLHASKAHVRQSQLTAGPAGILLIGAQSTLEAGSKLALITFIFKPGLSSNPTFWNAENLGSGSRLKPLIRDWIALSETKSLQFWISLDPRFNPAFWIPAYGFRSWDHTPFSFDRRRDDDLRFSNETPSRSLRCTGVSHSISRTLCWQNLQKRSVNFIALQRIFSQSWVWPAVAISLSMKST